MSWKYNSGSPRAVCTLNCWNISLALTEHSDSLDSLKFFGRSYGISEWSQTWLLSHKWPWTSDLPGSTCLVLRLQVFNHTLTLFGGEDQTQGFKLAKQAFYHLSQTPSSSNTASSIGSSQPGTVLCLLPPLYPRCFCHIFFRLFPCLPIPKLFPTLSNLECCSYSHLL